MNKKILICTGGTGGHVIPAINFGNFLINKGFECCLILDQRGNKFSKNFNGKIFIIRSSHLSGNIFYKCNSLIDLLIGFIQSLFFLNKIKPNICIGFGSYATFMPLTALFFYKLFKNTNLYLHEQNSVVGKVNLFFLPFSKSFFTNFREAINLPEKYKKKKIYVGLPDNKKFNIDISKKNNISKKIIFIYGGSQGSQNLITNFLLVIKTISKNELDKLKFVIQCPKKLNIVLEKNLKNLKVDYEIKTFFYDIDNILSKTDIAITRAGAGTINDLIRHKVPSIIFPLPNSIYNHQYYNAKFLLDKKACIVLDESNFNLNSYSKSLNKLIIEKKYFEKMQESINNIILPDTNELILKTILNKDNE